MSEYFSELKSSGGRVKIELDLSNYATKTDLENATGVDTSKFAKKIDLASLKSNADKLDIDRLKNVQNNLSNLQSKFVKLDPDKLVPVSVDLSKLSDVVKNIVKKDVCNVKKNIQDKIIAITNFANNFTILNEVKNEIPSIISLVTTTALNAKINEVKKKIPNITNLAATTTLTAVENKIPNVSNLVKKFDYNT